MILTVHNFRLSRRCKWKLRSFWVLRSVEWEFRTDVSGQPIGPTVKVKLDALDLLV